MMTAKRNSPKKVGVTETRVQTRSAEYFALNIYCAKSSTTDSLSFVELYIFYTNRNKQVEYVVFSCCPEIVLINTTVDSSSSLGHPHFFRTVSFGRHHSGIAFRIR